MEFLRDLYHAYRHVRFVRLYERSKNTRWSQGIYLKRGGDLKDICGVEGTIWTLYDGEKVDTKDIAHMTTARFEFGYD
ncbi:hypothetical protein [uncultured Roseobacter sp.]|uniref:hypothetical protein n=1 Tax=uncultured Roseobacter sp. TaxID=114847 RepID=UPI0026324186|nr:hypothetical protein [uncultured Roseobacter sp.]